MDKKTFLKKLRRQLKGLPGEERQAQLNFYAEMIEDRMEDGLSEEEAVAAIGVAEQEKKEKKGVKVWTMVLIVLALPVLISLFAAAFSVYISLWAVVLSLWACLPAFAAAALGGIVFSVCSAGVALFGASVVCAGLAIFWFFGCKAATKAMVCLTKKLVKKEAAK